MRGVFTPRPRICTPPAATDRPAARPLRRRRHAHDGTVAVRTAPLRGAAPRRLPRPPTVCDRDTAATGRRCHVQTLGAGRVAVRPASTATEDFPLYGRREPRCTARVRYGPPNGCRAAWDGGGGRGLRVRAPRPRWRPCRPTTPPPSVPTPGSPSRRRHRAHVCRPGAAGGAGAVTPGCPPPGPLHPSTVPAAGAGRGERPCALRNDRIKGS